MSRGERTGFEPGEPTGSTATDATDLEGGGTAGRPGDGERGGSTDGAVPETVRHDPRPSETGTALAGLVGFVAVVTQAAAGPAVVVGGVVACYVAAAVVAFRPRTWRAKGELRTEDLRERE